MRAGLHRGLQGQLPRLRSQVPGVMVVKGTSNSSPYITWFC